jgi:hypothetical protein
MRSKPRPGSLGSAREDGLKLRSVAASFLKDQNQVREEEQEMNCSLKHVRAFERERQHADDEREQQQGPCRWGEGRE